MKKLLFSAVLGIVTVLLIVSNIDQNFGIFAQDNKCTNTEDLDLIEIEGCLSELQEALEASKKATQPLESQLENLENRLAGIETRVGVIENNLAQKREEIAAGYDALEEQQLTFNSIVKDSYIKTYSLSPLLLFFSSSEPSDFIKFLTYQRQNAERDKSEITNIAIKLTELEERKANLEQEERSLASVKETLSAEREEVEEVVSGAKEYQENLTGQIAELSAQQQQILSARSGFTVSGNSELADDYLASIQGFNESAPSGHFAVFSFGGYSHRNGMSQYGALGRSENGQDYEEILSAYYPDTSIQDDYSAMDQITVDGHGSGSFEDWYLHRIYEVPESWPKEVLKAQAIAARTYAIRRTNNGESSICATQGCQVFRTDPKTGAWKEAVEETRGQVLVDGGGNPVSTEYASTHGGWANGVGWDTTDGSGGSDLLEKAYDGIGGSPWLYKAWWREGYSSSGATCGRSNPWLSPEEMADIVNAHLVLSQGSSDEAERVTPITTQCWDGDNPYSHDELRDVASQYGGISSANSVSVTQGEGKTNDVTINGVSMNGDEFCKAFNLRAPGNLRIPQWSGNECGGAFFNIERK